MYIYIYIFIYSRHRFASWHEKQYTLWCISKSNGDK